MHRETATKMEFSQTRSTKPDECYLGYWQAPDSDDRFVLQNKAIIRVWRSEEHTYELQLLMRTSYAVFCLKEKHTLIHKHIYHINQFYNFERQDSTIYSR